MLQSKCLPLPTHLYVETFSPVWWYLEMGTLESDLVEGEPSWMGLMPLLKESPQEDTFYEPESDLVPDLLVSWTWTSQPESCGKCNLLFICHPVYGIFVITSKKTKTETLSLLFLPNFPPKHFWYHGTNSIPYQRAYKERLYIHWLFILSKRQRLLSLVSNDLTIFLTQ